MSVRSNGAGGARLVTASGIVLADERELAGSSLPGAGLPAAMAAAAAAEQQQQQQQQQQPPKPRRGGSVKRLVAAVATPKRNRKLSARRFAEAGGSAASSAAAAEGFATPDNSHSHKKFGKRRGKEEEGGGPETALSPLSAAWAAAGLDQVYGLGTPASATVGGTLGPASSVVRTLGRAGSSSSGSSASGSGPSAAAASMMTTSSAQLDLVFAAAQAEAELAAMNKKKTTPEMESASMVRGLDFGGSPPPSPAPTSSYVRVNSGAATIGRNQRRRAEASSGREMLAGSGSGSGSSSGGRSSSSRFMTATRKAVTPGGSSKRRSSSSRRRQGGVDALRAIAASPPPASPASRRPPATPTPRSNASRFATLDAPPSTAAAASAASVFASPTPSTPPPSVPGQQNQTPRSASRARRAVFATMGRLGTLAARGTPSSLRKRRGDGGAAAAATPTRPASGKAGKAKADARVAFAMSPPSSRTGPAAVARSGSPSGANAAHRQQSASVRDLPAFALPLVHVVAARSHELGAADLLCAAAEASVAASLATAAAAATIEGTSNSTGADAPAVLAPTPVPSAAVLATARGALTELLRRVALMEPEPPLAAFARTARAAEGNTGALSRAVAEMSSAEGRAVVHVLGSLGAHITDDIGNDAASRDVARAFSHALCGTTGAAARRTVKMLISDVPGIVGLPHAPLLDGNATNGGRAGTGTRSPAMASPRTAVARGAANDAVVFESFVGQPLSPSAAVSCSSMGASGPASPSVFSPRMARRLRFEC